MSVYRRGARWRAQYRHPGTGQRVSKTFATKREATAWIEDNGSEVRQGTWRPPNKVTVAEACRVWIDECEESGMRPSSVEAYRGAIERHVVPRIGAVKLADLTTGTIESALIRRMLRDGKAEATVRHACIPLSQSLQRGVRHGLVRQNVAREIDWRSLVPKDRERLPGVSYTQEQLRRLVEHAPTADARVFIGLLCGTGLRVGEGLALRGRDLGEGTVSVERTVRRRHVGPPKTPTSERVVPVEGYMDDWRWALDAARELAADRAPDDLVFPSPRGGPREGTDVQRTWLHKAQDGAKLPRAGWHSLRRSYTHRLRELGVHPADMRDLLGHAKADLSVDLYAGRERDPAARLARLRGALRPAGPGGARGGATEVHAPRNAGERAPRTADAENRVA